MQCIRGFGDAGAAAVDSDRAAQSNFSGRGTVLRGWQMSHVSSTAAHSASVDFSHSVCFLHVLVHRSLVHCHSRYELDVFKLS